MLNTIGLFFVLKARRQARELGHFRAAANLRKQGVPLHIAHLILFGKV